ncbi:hypothetical protein BJX96DRAFT_185801 [Aspergillus floccosus]
MRTQSEYWKKYLAGCKPCLFPPLTPKDQKDTRKGQTTAIALDHDSEIRRFCHQHGVSPLNVFQLAWAFVLSRYAATDDVVFGYRENATFDGSLVLEEESIFRVRFPLESSVLEALRLNGSRLPRHRAFQTGAIPATMRLAGYKGQRLFNTFLYLEPSGESVASPVDGFATRLYPNQTDLDDQYDVIVKISVAEDVTACSFVYSSGFLGDAQAQHLALTFSRVLDAILVHGDQCTDELDLLAHASSVFTEDASLGGCVYEHKSIPERCVENTWDGESRYQKLQGMSV